MNHDAQRRLTNKLLKGGLHHRLGVTIPTDQLPFLPENGLWSQFYKPGRGYYPAEPDCAECGYTYPIATMCEVTYDEMYCKNCWVYVKERFKVRGWGAPERQKQAIPLSKRLQRRILRVARWG